MKAKSTLLLTLTSVLAAPGLTHAAIYTWSNSVTSPAITANWSAGTGWSGVPVSASDTTLSLGLTFTSNSTAQTNTLTNDVANPFQLNVLTFAGNTPTAANGTNIAAVNIDGSPLNFVLDGSTTPVVNLNSNRSNGQQVRYNVQSNVTLSDDITFQGNGTATFNFSGIISGTNRTLTKNGSSALTLSGANDFTGGVALNAGTLIINSDASLGAIGNNITLGGNAGITSAAAANVVYTRAIPLGANTLTLQNTTNATTASFSGAITGTGGITVVAGGTTSTVALSNAANNFTGDLTLSTAGNTNLFVSFSSIGDAGVISTGVGSWRRVVQYTGASNLVLGTRRIDLGGSFANVYDGSGNPINMFESNGAGTVTFNSNLTVANNRTGTFFFGGTNTGDNTFAGLIPNSTGGTLSIGKSGAGKWILTNDNTYTGNAIAAGGTLSVAKIANAGVAQPLGQGSILQLGDRGGTGNVEFTGTTNTTTDKQVQIGGTQNNLTGGGGLLNNGTGTLSFTNATFNSPHATATVTRTLTLGGANASNNTISGTIQNNNTGGNGLVALTKIDAGKWILEGDNIYTGATNVNGGTLLVNGDQTAATGAVTVAAAGTLGGTGTVGGATTVNGKLSPGASPGTLTFAGNLTVNNGSTYVFEAGDLAAVGGILDLNNNWTLAVGSGFQDDINGSVTIFTYGTLAAAQTSSPPLISAFLALHLLHIRYLTRAVRSCLTACPSSPNPGRWCWRGWGW